MKKILYSFLLVTLITGCNNSNASIQNNLNQTNSVNTFNTVKKDNIFNGELLINGTVNSIINPISSNDLLFKFKDQAGSLINQFELDHEKYMHLIVVNNDLSTFAHIHPDLSNDGSFKISVNKPTTDPDNMDAKNSMTKPGKYMLFTEVKPKGLDDQTSRFSVVTTGTENPSQIVPDQQIKPGTIIKYFTDKGGIGKAGDKYQIKLQIMKMSGMLNLNFTIQEDTGSNQYKDVTDLEKLLGMTGHAIVIGKAGNNPEEKVFLHLHSGHDMPMPRANGMNMKMGPKLEFMMMGKDIPPAGTYKAWGQFKHHGQVFAVPFVFNL